MYVCMYVCISEFLGLQSFVSFAENVSGSIFTDKNCEY